MSLQKLQNVQAPHADGSLGTCCPSNLTGRWCLGCTSLGLDRLWMVVQRLRPWSFHPTRICHRETLNWLNDFFFKNQIVKAICLLILFCFRMSQSFLNQPEPSPCPLPNLHSFFKPNPLPPCFQYQTINITYPTFPFSHYSDSQTVILLIPNNLLFLIPVPDIEFLFTSQNILFPTSYSLTFTPTPITNFLGLPHSFWNLVILTSIHCYTTHPILFIVYL